MNAEVRNIFFRTKRETGDSSGHSRELDEENDGAEVDGKMKTKLLSMWTNMKYGWTVKMKTSFSKDSPVWLLGRCYHRKMIVEPSSNTSMGLEGEGFEGFKADFITRVWLTYRREFPVLNGSTFTTDCGWGCMLRSGQMLLAQGLVCHLLGRGWRWYDQQLSTAELYHEDVCHRKIIKWFGDDPSYNSPFSIHMLVTLGTATGKKVGDWYGPGSVSHLLRQAVELATKDYKEFEHLCVYVAQDCAVYVQDVVDLCDISQSQPQDRTNSSYSLPSWKSVILLVPVRLGAEKMNSAYGSCLTALLTLDHCIGIIGGRPKHSLYFVGFQDDKLIHLDPHYCQEVVNVWEPNFSLRSFHCRSPRKMNLSRLDPSCCIGFYCKTRDDFYNFMHSVQQKGCNINLLWKLEDAIAQKRPGKLSFGVLFHHDNAPALRATLTVETLKECQFKLLPHPPYSPDLAPSGFFLFLEMKKHLRGHLFRMDEAINEVVQWCDSQEVLFFSEGIQKLDHQWDKCIRLQGDYIEKS